MDLTILVTCAKLFLKTIIPFHVPLYEMQAEPRTSARVNTTICFANSKILCLIWKGLCRLNAICYSPAKYRNKLSIYIYVIHILPVSIVHVKSHLIPFNFWGRGYISDLWADAWCRWWGSGCREGCSACAWAGSRTGPPPQAAPRQFQPGTGPASQRLPAQKVAHAQERL